MVKSPLSKYEVKYNSFKLEIVFSIYSKMYKLYNVDKRNHMLLPNKRTLRVYKSRI